jgi:hypothetical protein
VHRREEASLVADHPEGDDAVDDHLVAQRGLLSAAK